MAKKEISGLFIRQYVIQKGQKKGTGSTPYCHFHPRKPSTQIAQGTVHTKEVPEGLPFYEPVCDDCVVKMKKNEWPESIVYKTKAAEEETTASQEAAEQTTNNTKEPDMRSKKSSPQKSTKAPDKQPAFSFRTWLKEKAKAGTSKDKLVADVKKEGILKHMTVSNAETLVKRAIPWLRSVGAKVAEDGRISLK